MQRQITEMLLKFALAQVTVLITFLELQRIYQYYISSHQYIAIGPYMIISSHISLGIKCHEFYDYDKPFVNAFGVLYTWTQYMAQVQHFVRHHGKLFQLSLAFTSLIIGLAIEFIGFISENQAIFVFDNLFTLILPHFALLANTITWGSQCIEDSPILDFLDFTQLNKIGFITLGTLSVLIFVNLLMAAFQLHNKFIQLCYGFLCSAFFVYVILVDIINFISSPSIVFYLFLAKFSILGLLLSLLYKIF